MNDRLERLRELLLQDRSELTNGNFAALSQCTTEIETIVTELETTKEAMDEKTKALFLELQQIATRNASMLNAVIEGTKTARRHIELIRRASTELNTYTSDGTLENVTPQTGKIEKRA